MSAVGVSSSSLCDRCWEIAESVAERSGFVKIGKLAEACGCEIIFRPLLVEAAITKRINRDDKWVVLINCEVHNFTLSDISYEDESNPLPVRTRNTIAHEIAHAILYDFLGLDFNKTGSLSKRLDSIEKSVERASPLLLLPKSKLVRKLRGAEFGGSPALSISNVAAHFGVSRQVFLQVIKRLRRHRPFEFLKCEAVREAAWGLLVSRGKKKFVTKSCWLFSNFRLLPTHPASQRILQKQNIVWDVLSFDDSEEGGKICIASACDMNGECQFVRFEVETDDFISGKVLFFRLVS